MSARRTSPGALQTSAVAPCAHTAELAHVIACESAYLIELIDERMGAGSEEANTLHAMRLVLARMGMMADTVALAHGGNGWASNKATGGLAAVWLLQSASTCAAYAALTQASAGLGAAAVDALGARGAA